MPTPDDLAVLLRCFPTADPWRPAWLRIKAALVAAGHDPATLERADVLTLLALLDRPSGGKGEASQADEPKLTGKASRRQAVLRRYPELAAERTPDGEPVYKSQRKVIAKLADELDVSVETIKGDIRHLKGKRLLPDTFNRHVKLSHAPRAMG